MSKDDVPKTLEKLREKLAWYKENQEIKTQEVEILTLRYARCDANIVS